MADPYWDNVVFLSGFEGGTIVDESPLAQTVTTYGAAAVSTTQSKFGTQALHLDGSSAISVPDAATFISGAGSYTIEAFVWIDPSNPNAWTVLGGQWQQYMSPCAWLLAYTNSNTAHTGFFDYYIDKYATGTLDFEILSENVADIAVSTWAHVALDYDGTNYRMYLDGVMVDGWTHTDTIPDASVPMFFGAMVDDTLTVSSGLIGYMDEIRITAGVARYASDSGFTPPTEAYPRSGETSGGTSTVSTTVTEGVVMDDGAREGASGGLELAWWHDTGAVTFDQSVERLTATVISSGLGITAIPEGIYAAVADLSDGIATTSTLVALAGVVAADHLGLSDVITVGGVWGVTAADIAVLRDSALTGVVASLIDAIGVTETLTALQAISIAESLNLTDYMTGSAAFNVMLSQGLSVADTLAQFFGAEVTDVVTVYAALDALRTTTETLSDGVGVEEVSSPTFLVSVIAADGVEISAAEIPQLIYTQEIVDGVEIVAGYLEPDGSLTTWTVNTNTGAITEYDNYGFNSFARVGNKYIAASSDGLYELIGDTDDGDAIVATLKGAYMQFGGTHLARLKAAYIAVIGDDGDFILKIDTLDGGSYSYRTSARSGRSTKVHMGKGQRARYFAYTLTSVGQDFDLDSIEFVPLVLERRV